MSLNIQSACYSSTDAQSRLERSTELAHITWASAVLQLQWSCVSYIEPAYSLGRILSPRSRTLACSHAIHSTSLPFNGLYFCIPCKYTDYHSFTGCRGMEGWVGLWWFSHSRQFTHIWSAQDRESMLAKA